MNLSARINVLRKKHQSLSAEVEVAQRSPAADDLQIAALKKEKLRLKEEISKLSQV